MHYIKFVLYWDINLLPLKFIAGGWYNFTPRRKYQRVNVFWHKSCGSAKHMIFDNQKLQFLIDGVKINTLLSVFANMLYDITF